MTPPMQAVMLAQSLQRRSWLLSWQAGSVATRYLIPPGILCTLHGLGTPTAQATPSRTVGTMARPLLFIACDVWGFM